MFISGGAPDRLCVNTNDRIGIPRSLYLAAIYTGSRSTRGVECVDSGEEGRGELESSHVNR